MPDSLCNPDSSTLTSLFLLASIFYISWIKDIQSKLIVSPRAANVPRINTRKTTEMTMKIIFDLFVIFMLDK